MADNEFWCFEDEFQPSENKFHHYENEYLKFSKGILDIRKKNQGEKNTKLKEKTQKSGL